MSPAVPLLLLLGLPLLDLYTLIKVGAQIGALSALGLTLATGVAGLLLVRRQGFATLMRLRDAMERGAVPAAELLEGAALLLAGLLLALPGFITDIIGLVLLIPPLRRWGLGLVLRRARVAHPSAPPDASRLRIIEGEYRREDD